MNEETVDRLHAIVAASVALRYLLEMDADEWKTIPCNIQNAINSAAIACDTIAEAVVS